MTVNNNNHYVKNEDLIEPLMKYRKDFYEAKEKGLPRPKLPDSIGVAIFKIADGLTKRWNWSKYTYKDEMRQDATENCVKYIHNFSPEKGKPFSYINMICQHAFVRRLQQELKHQSIKTSMIQRSMDATVATQEHDDRVYSNTFIDFMKDVLDEEDVAMIELENKQEEHRRQNEKSLSISIEDEENIEFEEDFTDTLKKDELETYDDEEQ